MGNIIDNLAKEFKAQELTLIAEIVKLSPVSRWGNRLYSEAIITCIQKPKIQGDHSQLQIVKTSVLEETAVGAV